MKKSPLDQAVEAIQRGNNFVITCHGKPDGDALGSSLAMARALRLLGKDVTVLSQDVVPELYSFLPESETVVTDTDRRDFDTAIICDVQEPLRADRAEKIIQNVPVKVFIDHHPTPEHSHEQPENADKILVCDTNAAATAEVVLEVIDALGVELDKTMASQVMGAIVTDTGGFRFPNVTPQTFAIASRLASLGADASSIAQYVYERRPFVGTKLLGRALAGLGASKDGKVVWARINKEDFEDLGASDEDTESIANFVRSVKGAEVGILFRELGDGIRVSLRSHGGCNVSQTAEAFGGGGHKAAAGCTLKTSLEDAIKIVVTEVEKCTAS